MPEFLLNYGTLTAAVLLLLADLLVLILKGRTMPWAARTGLVVLLVLLAAYLAFVAWAVVAAGNPHPNGGPVPAGAGPAEGKWPV